MPMLQDASLEAAAHGRWQGALRALAEGARAQAASLLVRTRDTRRIVQFSTWGHDCRAERLYVSEFHRRDPTAGWLESSSEGQLLHADAWHEAPFSNHPEFVDGYLRPRQWRHVLATRINRAFGLDTLLWLHRTHERPPFEGSELERLDLLVHLPHVAQRNASRCASQSVIDVALREWLDLVPIPLVVCTPDGKAISSNAAGCQLLRSGRVLVSREGLLGQHDALTEAQLHKAIQGHADAVIQVMDKDQQPQLVHVHAKSPTGGPKRGIRIVSVPLARESAGVQALEKALKVTPAEAKAVDALVKTAGDVVKAAELLGIKTESVRTQMKRIYSRTGIRDKAELVQRAGLVFEMARAEPVKGCRLCGRWELVEGCFG